MSQPDLKSEIKKICEAVTTRALFETLKSRQDNQQLNKTEWKNIGLVPVHLSRSYFRAFVTGQTFDLKISVSIEDGKIDVKLSDPQEELSSVTLGYTASGKRFDSVDELQTELFRLVNLKTQVDDFVGESWYTMMVLHHNEDLPDFLIVKDPKGSLQSCCFCIDHGAQCERRMVRKCDSEATARQLIQKKVFNITKDPA